jgi:hypothetical protein
MRRKSTARRDRLWVVSLTMTLLLVVNAPMVMGQGTAYLTGFVKDPSGAAVPDATLTLKDLDTGIEQTFKTNESGVYRSGPLRAGSYELTIQAKGFQTNVQKGVVIELGQARGLDITLKIGEVSQQVEVTAEAPALKTEDAGLGVNISYEQVSTLPKFGRSMGAMLALAPGVRYTTEDYISYGASRYNIGGFGNANMQVDGARIMGDRMDISQMIFNPSIETLQEVKIVENTFNAEYGQDIGPLVQFETKSGTNGYHGNGWYYLRRTRLDATNGFTNVKPQDSQNLFGGQVGGPIKKNKLFFFSAIEIQKSKIPSSYLLTMPTPTELNGDFSGLKDPTTGNPITIYDPATSHTDPATGLTVRDPFPGNIIPQNRFDSSAVLAKAYFPAPATSSVTNNFSTTGVRTFRKIKGMEKFDWTISDKDKFTGEWMFDWTKNEDPGIAGYDPPPMSPSFGEPGFKFGTFMFNFQEVHTFSPNVILSNRFFYRPRHIERLNPGIDPGGQWAENLGIKNYAGAITPPDFGGDLGTPGYHFTSGIPYTNLGAGFLQFKENPIAQWNYAGDVTYIRGKQTIKAGIQTERGLHAAPNQNFPTGDFTFSGLATSSGTSKSGGDPMASFLLGLVDSAQTSIGPLISYHQWYYGVYIQDDIKVRPGLTINLGFRWDIDAPLYEANNYGNAFNPGPINPVSGTSGVITFLNGPGWPYNNFFNTNWHRFSPRFGFAWQVKPKTVVRGGYGIYSQCDYIGLQTEPASGFVTSAAFGSPDGGLSPAFMLSNGFPSYPVNPNKANQNDAYGAVPVGQVPSTSPVFVPRDLKNGYTQNMNVSIQQQLPWNMVLEVAAQGVLGRKLVISTNWNEVDPQYWGLSGSNNARRPYPQFGNVTQIRSNPIGTTNYWAGYISLIKRYSGGLVINANYNYGRTIGFTGGSIYYPGLSRGPTIYQLGNSFGAAVPYQTASISAVYDLPFGTKHNIANQGIAAKIFGNWNIGGILTIQGGIPFTVTSGGDSLNGNSPLGNRVNLVGDPNAVSQSFSTWFNTAAFAAPANGQVGTYCCGNLRGPANTMLNFSITKAFPIKEGIRAMFDANFFNLFNTPQGGPPDSNLRSGTFGRVLGPAALGAGTVVAPYLSSRIVQLGFRFEF